MIMSRTKTAAPSTREVVEEKIDIGIPQVNLKKIAYMLMKIWLMNMSF